MKNLLCELLPTKKSYGIVSVTTCGIRFLLTGYQVRGRPRKLVTRYSKWLNTFLDKPHRITGDSQDS